MKIEYLNDECSEWLVDYGAKRKARYKHQPYEVFTDEQADLLAYAREYTKDRATVKALINMPPGNAYRLVEKLARTFCGIFSPTKTAGLEKAYIRREILGTLIHLLSEHLRRSGIDEVEFAGYRVGAS